MFGSSIRKISQCTARQAASHQSLSNTAAARAFSLRSLPLGEISCRPSSSSIPMSRSAYCYSTAAEGVEGSTAEGANTEAPPVEGNSNPVADAAKGKEAQAGPSEHEQLIIKKDKEVAELKNALLTTMADFDNLQKKTALEVKKAKDYAIQKFANDLVSTLDVLQMALKSVPEAKRTPAKEDETGTTHPISQDLVDLWRGVEMTHTELEKTLGRFGAVSFDPTGEKFDPNRHEALFQLPMPDKEPNTVFDCQKKGWLFKERLLRPAQVGVVASTE